MSKSSDNKEIVDEILRAEGWPKYTNHSNDRGGPTKGGITLKTLKSVHPDATIEDLRNLSEQEARMIYERDYIISPGFSFIIDDLLRWQVVDAGILSGQARASRWLQEALGIKVDGMIGPASIKAINSTPPHKIALKFCAIRSRALMRIVTDDSSQAVWAAGWMNRCMGFLEREAERESF